MPETRNAGTSDGNSKFMIRPEPKRANDDIAEYCRYFDRVATANGWTDEFAAQLFPGVLEVGSTVLDDMEPATLTRFSSIRAALVVEKETFREASVQKFFSMTMDNKESAEDYMRRCRTCLLYTSPSPRDS